MPEGPLSFFASPLHEHGDPHGNGHSHGHGHGESKTSPAGLHNTEITGGELEHQKTVDSQHVPFDRDCALHSSPAFHRHAEATTAELFYDLFFVANLTTFTSLKEINDRKSLTSYIGFFTLLWLTWYQVSLYDVRFSTDSVFERIAKAIHFGTMVGFAVMGPQWKPGDEASDYRTSRAFSLILMVSRFTLFLQYGVTFFYTKGYAKTRLPLILVMASSIIASIVYGGLTGGFPKGELQFPTVSHVYIAWYVIGIVETIVTVSVSCVWRVISFKGTHMVQRMSLLTLIILGEGIIVICKAISKIVKNDYLWSAAVVGQIISAILIIYFLYMLYFDRLQEEHFGTIRQQIWSFLHFPLHTVLVLVLQGVSNFVVWRQAVESLTYVEGLVNTDFTTPQLNGTAMYKALNETGYYEVFKYVPKDVDATKYYTDSVKALKNVELYFSDAMAGNATAEAEYTNAANEFLFALANTILESLSIKAPKAKEGVKMTQEEQFLRLFNVFELIFVYVFVAGGLALILMTILGGLSLPSHQRRVLTYGRLALNLVFGVGLCLIATLRYNDDLKVNYMASSWMIPTLCIALFLCVVINHANLPGAKAKAH